MAASTPKKSALYPILGAVGFLLPGAVTFNFAIGEAREIPDDWAKIAVPLLVLSGACLSWGLLRLVGKAGLGVGAVLTLAGLGAGYFVLDGKVSERQEFDRNRAALMETESFCDGKGAADDRAMPYDADEPGTYTTMFYGSSSYGSSWSSSYDDAYEKWSPRMYQIQQVSLVACIKEERQPPIEKCLYTEGRSLERVKIDVGVKLFAIDTGKLVFETTLEGGMPRECEGLEKFYGDYKDSTITGEIPTPEVIAVALRPHIERK